MFHRQRKSSTQFLVLMTSSISTQVAKIKMENVMEMDSLSMMMEVTCLDPGFTESETVTSGQSGRIS